MSVRLTAGIATALWAGAAALALHERRRAVRPDDEPPLRGGPRVSVVVPARDEERGIGAAIRSLRALEWGDLEVIVVDDQSRDGTLAAARAAAGDDPRVTVIAGAPLPDGWVGKSWACWQGVQRATGSWLLFTDADVVHAPDSLGRTMALARRLGRGGLTMFPTVVCEGVAERVVTPAALVAIGTFVAPGPLARRDGGRTAIAAGGYILVKRRLYDAVGGHLAIRTRMVDDVCLAAAVKRFGAQLVPVPAGRLARLRMYHGPREVWSGWSKNASFAAVGPPVKGLVSAAVIAAVALGPAAATVAGLRGRDRRLAAIGVAGVASMTALQRLSSPAVPTPAHYAPTLPLGMVVLAGATARGALERLVGLGPAWRGRRYPLAR
jgi:hypothetical protein